MIRATLLCFLTLFAAYDAQWYSFCDSWQRSCDNGKCVSRKHWCDGVNNCGDFSDERGCYSSTEDEESIDETCEGLDVFECGDNSCIPSEKHCDGHVDCTNGLDEDNCDFHTLSSVYLNNNKTKAIQWMRSQHSVDWGWKENTNRAVVALYLAGDFNFKGSSKDSDLISKQLELEVATYLLRRQSDNISSAADLAMYVNALLAICHDPRNFYGYDLISYLKEDLETDSSFAPPFPYLTLCNAKEPISEDKVDRLLSILNIDSPNHGFVLELQALAIMALSCINRDDNMSQYLEQNITEAFNNLKKEQMTDGSFGNEYTTALVLQALMASNQSAKDWNIKSSIKYLSKRQDVNGSFGNFLTTYLMMPVLNAKSLLDIGKINCSSSFRSSRSSDTLFDIKSRLGKKMIVKYSLIVGDKKDQIHPMILRTPENITVLELMSLAADIDPKYNFKTHEIKKKEYIYEISNLPNDPENSKFWFIYRVANNETIAATEQSPSKIYVHENDDIIMWYKTLESL